MKDQLKKIYQSIPIPDELGERVERVLSENIPRRRMRPWKKVLFSFAACLCAFVLFVNVSPTFAASLYELPVVGNMAMMFTFREYHKTDDAKNITVKIPAIRNVGDSALEKQINNRIFEKMQILQAQAEKDAEDYLEAYNATKSKNDPPFWKVDINIDYEMKYSTENTLSFVLNSGSAAASFFMQQYFYNIDLKTGKDLTLHDLLGENYRDICNQTVYQGIKDRVANVPGAFFFTNEDEDTLDDDFAFSGITDDQKFYINEKGHVVLVFEKYSIAPGYMGIQEFEVIPAA
ncbi:DUF3298 and DUF4163 domain-containing protein [Acidaminobacterium chupaoyuni]